MTAFPSKCPVCGVVPRMFSLFGGGYWQRVLREWLCPTCAWWAETTFGLPSEPSPFWDTNRSRPTGGKQGKPGESRGADE